MAKQSLAGELTLCKILLSILGFNPDLKYILKCCHLADLCTVEANSNVTASFLFKGGGAALGLWEQNQEPGCDVPPKRSKNKASP